VIENVIADCTYPGPDSVCSGVKNIAPVGSKPLGNGRWGQADLSGNMAEWVEDWVGDWPVDCTDCITFVPDTNGNRTVRGGAYDSFFFGLLETTVTIGTAPVGRGDSLGFRCARAPL
jgi:formylglycine-generating enzyme required for sulfatase activity